LSPSRLTDLHGGVVLAYKTVSIEYLCLRKWVPPAH